jgi:hypothetical protein
MTDTKELYEKRTDCLKNLLSIQNAIEKTETIYIHATKALGRTDMGAWATLGNLQTQYYDEYQRCRNTLDPKKR